MYYSRLSVRSDVYLHPDSVMSATVTGDPSGEVVCAGATISNLLCSRLLPILPAAAMLLLAADIADAFDSGALSGDTSVNEIAEAVGVSPASVGMAIETLDFATVKSRRILKPRVPARWSPTRWSPRVLAC